MRRAVMLSLAVAVTAALPVYAQKVTPDDLINAADQMTSEQVYTLYQKLESKVWKPLPEGFWTRLAARLSISGNAFDEVDLSALDLSAGEMCLDSPGGSEVTLLWRAFSPKFHMGIELGSWYAEDSDLTAAGYSQAELGAGYAAFAVSYQLIRARRAIIWTDVGLGGGGVQVQTVDTPAGMPTTLREFDGSFALANLRLGIAWRANPMLTVFFTGGYRFAESVDLEEGGECTDLQFDASGGSGQFGLGFNF